MASAPEVCLGPQSDVGCEQTRPGGQWPQRGGRAAGLDSVRGGVSPFGPAYTTERWGFGFVTFHNTGDSWERRDPVWGMGSLRGSCDSISSSQRGAPASLRPLGEQALLPRGSQLFSQTVNNPSEVMGPARGPKSNRFWCRCGPGGERGVPGPARDTLHASGVTFQKTSPLEEGGAPQRRPPVKGPQKQGSGAPAAAARGSERGQHPALRLWIPG